MRFLSWSTGRPRSAGLVRIAILGLLLALGKVPAWWPVLAASPKEPSLPARKPPVHVLKRESAWLLQPAQGERFDASGLLFLPRIGLVTVNDRDPRLYSIRLSETTNQATLELVAESRAFLRFYPGAGGAAMRPDCEGLALDEQGRVYQCEETRRWVVRWDRKTDRVERLDIDWAPVAGYFSRMDGNASFEGIAVGGGAIYVANERWRGRILVVDPVSLKVTGDFAVFAGGVTSTDVHYSDLAWHGGFLFVLCRDARRVLKVDPATRKVLAEFDYRALEEDPEYRFRTMYPTGNMEGLAVDATHVWLVTDNNGEGRTRAPEDRRPALFRCRRPDL